VALGARVLVIGEQFEDDRNTLVLRRAVAVDLTASRWLAARCLAFAVTENLLDNDYDVGRTPLRTTGSPRLLRVGLRLTIP
jgi:hypothetical protein